jgi:hypothetical protein
VCCGALQASSNPIASTVINLAKDRWLIDMAKL